MTRDDLGPRDHALHELRTRVSNRLARSLVLVALAEAEVRRSRWWADARRHKTLRATRPTVARVARPRVRRHPKRASLRIVPPAP